MSATTLLLSKAEQLFVLGYISDAQLTCSYKSFENWILRGASEQDFTLQARHLVLFAMF